MNINQITQEILKNNFELECELVGQTNIEDIISSDVEFASSDGGLNIDLKETIELLVVASAFIKVVIDSYLAIKKNTAEKAVNEIDLLEKIFSNKEVFKRLDKATQKKIIKSIIQRLPN